jgi:hypothetical protein
MRVIRGSHTQELRELQQAGGQGTEEETDTAASLNVLGSQTHTLDEILHSGKYNAPEDVVLNPGDISIHHPNLIHGSEANTSDRRRCGLTIRYMPTDVQALDDSQPVMLFRGDAAAEGSSGAANKYRSWPKYREGYDMAFKGAGKWNAGRYTDAADEAAYFDRTDFEAMDGEIAAEVNSFVEQLGGKHA